MSTISASTTTNTALVQTADTTGQLVFQTGASPTTAMTISSSQVVNFANTPQIAGSGLVVPSTTGTSGQYLQSNGTSTPVWAAVSSGAMTLISTVSITSGTPTTIVFSSIGTYNRYMLIFDSLVPNATNDNMIVYLGYGGTPTYLTSGYRFQANYFNTSPAGSTVTPSGYGYNNWGSIPITYSNSEYGNYVGSYGYIIFSGTQNTNNYAAFNWQVGLGDGSSNFAMTNGAGFIPIGNGAITAIKLAFASSSSFKNSVGGTASLYGISS